MLLALATILTAVVLNAPLTVTHNPGTQETAPTHELQPAETKNHYQLTVRPDYLQGTVSGQSLQGSSPNLQPAHNPVQ